MRNDPVLDLADCAEFRQALQARPPAIVHGAAALLALAIGAALAWSAATQATLVVRAPGRVRPEATPIRVASAARGEALGAGVGGRVASVHFVEGDQVRRGDLLIRLETTRLDNDLAKQREAIRSLEEELGRLSRVEGLTRGQYEITRAKAEAELEQARVEILQERRRREAELARARAALEGAEQERDAARQLVSRRVAPPADLIKANLRYHEAREALAKAEIPVDEGRLEVLRRALELTGRDFALASAEAERTRAAKQAELEAARIELANLELIRKQAELRAPVDGVVISGDVKAGDLLEPGKTVVEIARSGDLLFEAVVPSEEVGDLRVGMPARIKLDAYDYQRYGTLAGAVGFISPDSGVVRPRGDEEPVEGVFYTVRIRLPRLEVGRGKYHGRAKLGMAGQAEIVTDRESLLSLLVKRIRRTISLG